MRGSVVDGVSHALVGSSGGSEGAPAGPMACAAEADGARALTVSPSAPLAKDSAGRIARNLPKRGMELCRPQAG